MSTTQADPAIAASSQTVKFGRLIYVSLLAVTIGEAANGIRHAIQNLPRSRQILTYIVTVDILMSLLCMFAAIVLLLGGMFFAILNKDDSGGQ